VHHEARFSLIRALPYGLTRCVYAAALRKLRGRATHLAVTPIPSFILPPMKKPPDFKRLNRIDIEEASRFITFSCFRQRKLFTLHSRCIQFTDALHAFSISEYIDLHGWVLMPDHCHLLVTPASQHFEAWLERFKRSVATRLRRVSPEIGPIWRAGGGYDRTIYTCGEFKEKLLYIHRNATRAGLVQTKSDWPWHSWHECEGTSRAGMPRIVPMSAERLSRAKEAWHRMRSTGRRKPTG
jgi:putative transposase